MYCYRCVHKTTYNMPREYGPTILHGSYGGLLGTGRLTVHQILLRRHAELAQKPHLHFLELHALWVLPIARVPNFSIFISHSDKTMNLGLCKVHGLEVVVKGFWKDVSLLQEQLSISGKCMLGLY